MRIKYLGPLKEKHNFVEGSAKVCRRKYFIFEAWTDLIRSGTIFSRTCLVHWKNLVHLKIIGAYEKFGALEKDQKRKNLNDVNLWMSTLRCCRIHVAIFTKTGVTFYNAAPRYQQFMKQNTLSSFFLSLCVYLNFLSINNLTSVL